MRSASRGSVFSDDVMQMTIDQIFRFNPHTPGMHRIGISRIKRLI
jgi:hypothetical protein